MSASRYRLNAPIVLVHGLLGYDQIVVFGKTIREYFPGIRSFLETQGNRVLVPRVSPTASITQRALELKNFIQLHAPDQPVHLFGHSMGGLDSRYMITHLGMDRHVLSLTTIGTPHRGTSFADWGIQNFAVYLQPCFQAVRLPHEAFFDLTTQRCTEFNCKTPDSDRVRYFSVAGDCQQHLLGVEWKFSASIVQKAEGPNDGVVSVASATWGEAIEVWPGDHLNLTNWPNRHAGKLGLSNDRIEDYGRLVERLRQMGF